MLKWKAYVFRYCFLDTLKETVSTLERIIGIYHTRRPHLSLGMLTPEQVHNGEMPGFGRNIILKIVRESRNFSTFAYPKP